MIGNVKNLNFKTKAFATNIYGWKVYTTKETTKRKANLCLMLQNNWLKAYWTNKIQSRMISEIYFSIPYTALATNMSYKLCGIYTQETMIKSNLWW